MESHPVWVRGLKPYQAWQDLPHMRSHPVWVRGLKREQQVEEHAQHQVAPRVGAWIETL